MATAAGGQWQSCFPCCLLLLFYPSLLLFVLLASLHLLPIKGSKTSKNSKDYILIHAKHQMKKGINEVINVPNKS